jgi:hypothetical protein
MTNSAFADKISFPKTNHHFFQMSNVTKPIFVKVIFEDGSAEMNGILKKEKLFL